MEAESLPQGRPSLSRPLMREVRQRCGFGCVICGHPIYEYDHLLGWTNVKRHEATEITLLCPIHHKEKTAGLLPGESVLEANRDPWNLRSGVTAPYTLKYTGDAYFIDVGSLVYGGRATGTRTVAQAIRIDGEPLISVTLEDGHFLLSLAVYDRQGSLVLHIIDNELVLNLRSWDIEFVGKRLTVRQAARDILFDIVFKPPSTVMIQRGWILRNGVEIMILPDMLVVLNTLNYFIHTTIVAPTGLIIDDDRHDLHAAVAIDDVPREDWGRPEAIKWARAKAKEHRRTATALGELLNANILG